MNRTATLDGLIFEERETSPERRGRREGTENG